MPVHVLHSHTASYASPIAVEQGDVLVLSGRTDLWDGHLWLWAKAADGSEGWVPDALVPDPRAGSRKARFDYSAEELSCSAGEVLTAHQKLNGWTWCSNEQGDEGWVPDQSISNK